ncbi:MAG TPA: T9SS type A sorting domain-containing protein [Candidatus Kapabacteria bacterium]|nr:T9SS type A sorting domain-containing protein [Candidatus Kapabacteria bacterium]
MIALSGTASAQKNGPAEAADRDEHHAEAREQWFEDFRNPLHEANYDQIILQGLEQMRSLNNRPAMEASSSAAWIEVSKSQDGSVSGRGSTIAFDPNGAIYYGTTLGGLWKTTDLGQNWVSLSDSWKVLAVGGVAVDPVHPNIIYAGTGVANGLIGGASTAAGVGIYKSTDNGLNWTLLPLGNMENVTTQMEVNPANTNLIYHAGLAGIFVSADAGETWSHVLSSSTMSSFVINPLDPAVLYATVNGAIEKSNDSGMTWAAAGTGYSGSINMSIAMSPADTTMVYVSSSPNGSAGIQSNLYLSIDGGTTWTLESTGYTDGNENDHGPAYLHTQGFYANALAVNPANAKDVIVGGLDIWASTQGGASLQKKTNWLGDVTSSNYTHADIHVLKYNPYTKTLFALTDGGVYHSESNGSLWKQDMNTNLGTLQFVGGDMFADPTTGDIELFAAGAQDNGLNTAKLGDAHYTSVRGGDGGTMFIGQDYGQIIYGTYIDATLYSSATQGSDLNTDNVNLLGTSPIQNDHNIPFYIEYDVCDADPSVVAVCSSTNLYLTTDGGGNTYNGAPDFPQVTNISGDVPNRVSGSVRTVHISKADPNTIYIGTTSSLYYSTDQASTWTRTSTTIGTQPTSITTDPNDPTHAFMTLNGATSTSKHFGISTDNGQTWNFPAATSGPNALPTNVTYHRVAVDQKGQIFVGNDYGVLRSGDNGITWYPVADGLPQTLVTGLHVRGHYLLASTYGRGMWYVDINQLAPLPITNGVVASSSSNAANTASIAAIYPNPISTSSARSTVKFSVAANAHTTLAVYDVLGHEEKMLMNDWTQQGEHDLTVDLSGLPAGQHYIVLTADGSSVTKAVTIE